MATLSHLRLRIELVFHLCIISLKAQTETGPSLVPLEKNNGNTVIFGYKWKHNLIQKQLKSLYMKSNFILKGPSRVLKNPYVSFSGSSVLKINICSKTTSGTSNCVDFIYFAKITSYNMRSFSSVPLWLTLWFWLSSIFWCRRFPRQNIEYLCFYLFPLMSNVRIGIAHNKSRILLIHLKTCLLWNLNSLCASFVPLA